MRQGTGTGAGPSGKGVRILFALIVGGLAGYAFLEMGPLVFGPVINWPAVVTGGCVMIAAIALAEDLFALMADALELLGARTPKGLKGTAKWCTSLWSIRKDLLRKGWGPYWGVMALGWFLIGSRGKPIFADYESNAVTFGTAGSGKGVGVVLPNGMAIRGPKLFTDFKGVNTCCLKGPLEARGETFRILNLGGLHKEIIGEGDFYNPVLVIADNFARRGGLQDVTGDCDEMCLQITPEPPDGGQGDGRYWRGGERDYMSFAIQQRILVHGPAATLGHALQFLKNREQLLKEALWVAGRLKDKEDQALPAMNLETAPWVKFHAPEDVENYIAEHRANAGSIADQLLVPDSKSADGFLSGARLSLAPYNITTRAHKVMSKSTFRFAEMKDSDQVTNVGIVIDPSRKETQCKIASLIQWCAFTELKRCENKRRKVYFLCDETTNFKIHDLPGLQTWGREFGIVWHGFIQSIAAYRAVYGREAVSTLLSETFIKQFLPGQRDPEMLQLIMQLLSRQAIVTKSHSGSFARFGVQGFGLNEDARPLMNEDEIRRTNKTILCIGANRPLLTTLPPIASIAPWRRQIGINPFFGKPYLKRIKLRLGKRDGNIFMRLGRRKDQ